MSLKECHHCGGHFPEEIMEGDLCEPCNDNMMEHCSFCGCELDDADAIDGDLCEDCADGVDDD